MNQAQFFCRVIKRLCNNKTLLPDEYQQVDYLQSSGGQYIDTLINPTSGSVLRVRIKIGGGSFSGAAIMGAQSTYRTATVYGYERSALGIGNGNLGAVYSNTKFDCTTDSELDFTIDDAAKKISGEWNGTPLSTSTYNNTYSGLNIYLFRNNYTNSQYAKVAMYYWQCYINGVKIRNFIPCYRISDNKPGMYDTVTRAFFTNAGTGDFTVGNNI